MSSFPILGLIPGLRLFPGTGQFPVKLWVPCVPGLLLVKLSFIVYQRKCRANREERLYIKFIAGCFRAHWFLPHIISLPMAGELELDVPKGPFQPNPFCDNIWVKLYRFHC